MYDISWAYIMFPADSFEESMRSFHEAMLIQTNKGEILSFQEFYGNILYFDSHEFPEEFKPMTPNQLEQAQDELRRRYNFKKN